MSSRLIFISYSHQDRTFKELLEKQLAALEQEGKIYVWTDSDIGVGEEWFEKIENALNNAWVAILLISDNSLTSDFILKEEVSRLLQKRDEEKLRIVPIIVRDCPWKLYPWLKRMQVRPEGGRALEKMRTASVRTELMNIVFEIAELFKTFNPVPPEPRLEVQDRARPETGPNLTGSEKQKTLTDLIAERDKLNKQIDEVERRINPLGSLTPTTSSYQETSSKRFEDKRRTSSVLRPKTSDGE